MHSKLKEKLTGGNTPRAVDVMKLSDIQANSEIEMN